MERLTRLIGTGLAALLVMTATTGFVDVKAQSPAPTPTAAPSRPGQQPLQAPTFKTSVSLVSVTAVVRDGKGRVVRNLKRNDFEIFEKGKSRPILDFKASDQGPISLAILFDVSGSMRMASNMEAGKRAVEFILSWVQPHADEIALFTFDRDLRQETPFTNDPAKVRTALEQDDRDRLHVALRRDWRHRQEAWQPSVAAPRRCRHHRRRGHQQHHEAVRRLRHRERDRRAGVCRRRGLAARSSGRGIRGGAGDSCLGESREPGPLDGRESDARQHARLTRAWPRAS